MLIGIEASRANRLQKTGVEWYAYHLIQTLKRLPNSANHSWLLYSNDLLSFGLEKGPRSWHEKRLSWPPKYLWTQMRLSLEMLMRAPDVLFVPAHVLPRFIPKKSVVTIHDIGFHRLPQLYPARQRLYHEWSTRDIIRRASRIITISAFSKQELIDVYRADPDHITVTHLGIDHDRYYSRGKEEFNAVHRRFKIERPFFLTIGRLERKKNITTLLDAFALFREMYPREEITLVLVGNIGPGYYEIEERLRQHSLIDHVSLLGYVTEDEKAALLSSAVAYVHPSWYEGFGLPPLEAMACGCPVICSQAASLPEVVGFEQALWFQPADAETLAEHMHCIIKNSSLRSEFVSSGLQWVKQYTWERTAERTLEALTVW